MRREEIVRLLRGQPFQPFQIRLSNGTVYPIRHPDMALPTLSAVHIAVPRDEQQMADDVVIVSLVHVVSLDDLPTPAATN